MSKEIILEAEMSCYPEVQLIKLYRKINKKIGELKQRPSVQNSLRIHQGLFMLNTLQKQAEKIGFQIWVNLNGKTGHTHSKDYRETPEEQNDYDTHVLEVATVRSEESID